MTQIGRVQSAFRARCCRGHGTPGPRRSTVCPLGRGRRRHDGDAAPGASRGCRGTAGQLAPRAGGTLTVFRSPTSTSTSCSAGWRSITSRIPRSKSRRWPGSRRRRARWRSWICCLRTTVSSLTSQNRFERMRDPSHTRALTVDELRDLLEAVGRPVDCRSLRQVEVDLDPWFDLTCTPVSTRKVISAALRRELDGGPTTGMRPRERGGRLTFRQTWALVRSDPLDQSVDRLRGAAAPGRRSRALECSLP